MSRFSLLILTVLFCLPLSQSVAEGDNHAGLLPDVLSDWHQLVRMFPDGRYSKQTHQQWYTLAHLCMDSDVAVAPDGSAYMLCGLGYGQHGAMTQVLLIKYDKSGRREWHRTFGEPLENNRSRKFLRGMRVAVDAKGNAYVAGISFNGANQNAFALSVSAAGKNRWSYELEHAGDQAASHYYGITVEGSSVFLVGTAAGQVTRAGKVKGSMRDILVTRLSTSGKHIWTQQLVGGEKEDRVAIDVCVNPKGLVCIAGAVDEREIPRGGNLPEGEGDGFVLALTPSGKTKWSARIGKDNLPKGLTAEQVVTVAYSVVADRDGNVFALGHTNTKGSVRPRPGVRDDPRRQTGYLISKLSPAGKIVWTTRFDREHDLVGSGFRATRVRLDADENPLVSARTSDPPAIFRFNQDGGLTGAILYAKNRLYQSVVFCPTHDGLGVVLQGTYHHGPNSNLFRDANENANAGKAKRVYEPHYYTAWAPLDTAGIDPHARDDVPARPQP